MLSLVIKIAKQVNRAVLLEIIKPALGFSTAKVVELIVEANPNKVSMRNNNTFCLFKPLYFFLYSSLSILSDFSIFS